MKSNEIMQKLEAYKEKLVKFQMKLSRIENKVQYKDIDRFGFYKPLLEMEFEKLELILWSLETNIEHICSMADGGCAFCELDDLDIEEMLSEQMEYTEKYIKSTVREIESDMRKSVK